MLIRFAGVKEVLKQKLRFSNAIVLTLPILILVSLVYFFYVAAVDSPTVPSDQRCRAPVQGAKVFYPVQEGTVNDTPQLSRRLSLQQR